MLEGNIEGLAFGGCGITRNKGLVTFIPFSAPGDTIKYTITNQKKNFANGEIVEIVHPSKQRTTPSCQYFGKCGGCQLQHLTYSAQLDYKRQTIEEALKRIGQLAFDEVFPVFPAKPWAYRQHISLTLQKIGAHFRVGYIATDNHTLIEIENCPLFEFSNDIIQHVRLIASKLISNDHSPAKVTICKVDSSQYILQFHFKALPKNCAQIMSESLSSSCTGISVNSPKKNLTWGQTEGKTEIEGLTISYSPTAFIQNHQGQSLEIYRQITQIANSLKVKKVLDLYCGIGILSLLLAKQGMEVHGVELNPEAVKLAKQNCLLNQIDHFNITCSDVGSMLPSFLPKFLPDMVIVNPPRTGLDPKVIQALINHPPKNLLYISCMPPTLARDLKHLSHAGYSIQEVRPYDMFPQTAHVETLVYLKQK